MATEHGGPFRSTSSFRRHAGSRSRSINALVVPLLSRPMHGISVMEQETPSRRRDRYSKQGTVAGPRKVGKADVLGSWNAHPSDHWRITFSVGCTTYHF